MVGSPFCYELCQLFDSCTRCFRPLGQAFYALGRLPWLAFFLRRSLRLRPRLLIAALLYLIGGSGRAVHVVSFHSAGPRAGGHDAIGR